MPAPVCRLRPCGSRFHKGRKYRWRIDARRSATQRFPHAVLIATHVVRRRQVHGTCIAMFQPQHNFPWQLVEVCMKSKALIAVAAGMLSWSFAFAGPDFGNPAAADDVSPSLANINSLDRFTGGYKGWHVLPNFQEPYSGS